MARGDGGGLQVDPNCAFVCIQRCDLCMRYESDEDACAAHVAALNRAAGALHFVRVRVRDDDAEIADEPSVRAGIGRLYGDARYEPLEHGAFRAECERLGIGLELVRAHEGDVPAKKPA